MSPRPNVTLCGRSLERPGHIGAFFDSRQELYDTLSPFYREGIEAGEEVITIIDAEQHDAHCEHMQLRGVPVDLSLATGMLKIHTAQTTYTLDGRFDGKRMYDMLQDLLATAKLKGRRVRASGLMMDWSVRAPGTEELRSYEARVNDLVPFYDCTLLCVYDLAKISGEMMMDILATHPYIIHRGRIIQNSYYLPPQPSFGF